MSLTQLVLAEKLRRFIETESHAEFKEVVAPFVDFAALKTPTKPKAKKEKVCKGKSSFPCGYSCQPRYTRSGKETQCKSALNGQAKTYAEWLEKQVKSVDPTPAKAAKTPNQVKPPDVPKADSVSRSSPQTLQEFIDRGREYGKPELDQIDDLLVGIEKDPNLKKLRKKLDTEYKKVLQEFEKDPSLASAYAKDMNVADPRLVRWRKTKFDLEKTEAANEAKVERLMFGIKRRLLYEDAMSRTDADKLTSDISIATKISDQDAKTIENAMIDAVRITNGKGAKSLKHIDQIRDRASANTDGTIDAGGYIYPPILFHEFGHHVEYESDTIRQAAQEFVKKRATGEPKSLIELTGDSHYRPDEKAYPDKFIHPYVGKKYEAGHTEVVSMGLEHFAFGSDMVKLYKADKEHFHFMLGIFRG